MKHLCVAVVVAVLVSVSPALGAEKAEKGAHLFILSGQSNMAGLNPQLSFIPAVTQEFGRGNVITVKSARGGLPIRCWYKKWKPAGGEVAKGNGSAYDRLMGMVNKSIKGRKIETVTFVWMQGERDARERHGAVYAASLQGLIAQLEGDLGRKDVNFVIGRISDFDMKNARYGHWTMVREAQVKVAEASPRGAWVDTDDLNDMKRKDGTVHHDLHYTREGYKTLGARFAQEAIALIKKTPEKGAGGK
jgi:hypothetical protein